VARYEVAGAIVQAEAQQMRYATRDFYAIQNWVDLSNDQLGVTVASPDAPMLHLGGFTNHKYLAAMQLEQPLLVGWPVNNHWFTNFRGSQSGWLRFRYRLLPHTAPFDAVAATRFGAEAAVEPLLGPVWDRPAGLERRAVPAPVHLPEQTSFLVLEPAHVHLIGLKPAANGQGITLRLQELAGQPADFRLHFPHSQVVSAEVCSLLEERIDGPQPVAAGHEVRGQIEPYRLQTLRVVLSAQ
jgi:alpha-mannosidase